MKKKRKMKKSITQIILLLIICGLVIGTAKYFMDHKTPDTKKANSEIKELMNKNNIKDSDYSKTLEYVLLNNIYDEKYLKEYKDIKFNNKEDFESILTTFLPKGYSGKEINYLFKLSEKNINILKEMIYLIIM